MQALISKILHIAQIRSETVMDKCMVGLDNALGMHTVLTWHDHLRFHW